MSEQVQFDRMIKENLIIKAQEITPSTGMAARVKDVVITNTRKRKMISFNPGWKKAIVAAACVVFTAISLSLVVSPSLQATAAEKIDSILNKVHVVMHTTKVDGKNLTSSETVFEDKKSEKEAQEVINRNRAKAGGSGSFPYTTLFDAEKAAGFNIKVPSYLPEGYKIPEMIFVGEYTRDVDGKLIGTGRHDVYMRFDGGKDSFQGLMLIISEIGMEFKPGFKYEAVRVGDREARWYESEITVQDEGKEPRKVVERALSWEEDGMTFLLSGCSGFSKAELFKIVKSIN